MVDYRALYFKLFGAIADAVEDLEQEHTEKALRRLIAVQQEAEEIYILNEE